MKHDLVISLIPHISLEGCGHNKLCFTRNAWVRGRCKEGRKYGNEWDCLYPEINYLYAVKTIEKVHKSRGRVTSFLSYSGGLKASDNSLGYKISRASRRVLLAIRNEAKYCGDRKVIEIASKGLIATAKPCFINPGYAFVAYPNRDLSTYEERYNILEAQTITRDTLRYQRFSELICTLVDMGFLSEAK